MDKEELIKAAQDPKYIPGIYNYCDRWCERCTFTSRCLNYSMGEESPDDLDGKDMRNEKFWQQLTEMFQITMEMIHDMAEEAGIDLDAIDDNDEDERAAIKNKTDSDLLSHISKNYIKLVDEWFENNAYLFYEKEKEMNSIRLISSKENPEKVVAEIKDVIDVISWYHYQIHVKIRRAIQSGYQEESEDDDFPKDSDGSAKVALIGIDRSISAWRVLLAHFSEQKKDISPMIESLENLRKRVEMRFPRARDFVRPGFDEI
jgi:hypothetical protein